LCNRKQFTMNKLIISYKLSEQDLECGICYTPILAFEASSQSQNHFDV
jgi:hypothetical protein